MHTNHCSTLDSLPFYLTAWFYLFLLGLFSYCCLSICLQKSLWPAEVFWIVSIPYSDTLSPHTFTLVLHVVNLENRDYCYFSTKTPTSFLRSTIWVPSPFSRPKYKPNQSQNPSAFIIELLGLIEAFDLTWQDIYTTIITCYLYKKSRIWSLVYAWSGSIVMPDTEVYWL